ncbi:hypothetical protein FOL47_006599, partial [Perkinsus chesapeaki]
MTNNPTNNMILRCNRTGQLFFTAQDAEDHAKAIGSQDFEEVSPEAKVMVSNVSGKYCFTEDEVNRFCMRTGEAPQNFTEITVAELRDRILTKQSQHQNDPRVIDFADSRKVEMLFEGKGYPVVVAEKALWFGNNNLKKAEEWIKEHENDADFKEPLKLPEGVSSPMDVDDDDTVNESGENPPSVKDNIDKDMLKELTEGMGFPVIRAEKALYFSDNAGVENAVQWLSEHENDADIDKPLPTPKPQMSKEEAKVKAMELQKKLREDRMEREKKEAREKEKARIENTKAMQETQAHLAEEKRKREMDEMQREREDHVRHRQELREKMVEDYRRRFGRDPPADYFEKTTDVRQMKPKEAVAYHLRNLKKDYKDQDLKGLTTCLKTLRVYLQNAHDHPTEKKYHRINKSNKAFMERVAPFKEAVDVLENCGFDDTGELSDGHTYNSAEYTQFGSRMKMFLSHPSKDTHTSRSSGRMEDVGIEPETYETRRVSYDAENRAEAFDIETRLERSLGEIRDVKNMLRDLLSKVDDLGRSTAVNLDRLREERELEAQRKKEARIREEERRASAAAAMEAARLREAEREQEAYYEEEYQRGRALVRNAVNLSPVDRTEQTWRLESAAATSKIVDDIVAGIDRYLFDKRGFGLIRGGRVSMRGARVLRRYFSGMTAAPEFEKVEKKWPRPTSRRLGEESLSNSLVGERQAVPSGEEKVLGSIPALGTPESMPSYHHEHMYKEDNLLALYELYSEGALDGYKEAWGSNLRGRLAYTCILKALPVFLRRVGLMKLFLLSYVSSLTWQLGPSGCSVTVEAEGASKKETKRIAIGKVASPDEGSAAVVASEGGVVLSMGQANGVMMAYSRLAARLADSASVGLDSHITFGEGLSGVSATIGWTWTEGKEKKSLTAKAEGSSKTLAKAAACLSILEQYGAVKPLPNKIWQDIQEVNSALDRGDIADGIRVAGRLLRSGPVHGWSLFLLHLWRSILASSDSSSVDELLGHLRHRSEKNGGGGIVPVYLWEAMVDECANLSDHAFASSMLERFLSLVKCEAFSDHSDKYSHWRGLIGLERITALQNALKESQDAGERPFTGTVLRDES